ncbi:MAG: hypothetical protein JKY88_02795 [Pseudomonadales bacterium]|nr:hypothetical protein [Pseudomonadales bacterium]
MAKTRAQLNREVRVEALRQQLANQKHVEHVVDWINEMANPATSEERLFQLNVVVSQTLKLVNKYLPDLKAIEMNIEGEAKQYVISSEPIDAEQWERIYSLEAPSGATESVN